ncbi:hypothetical protein [Actinoplanes sp. NPDC026623]|uniref:hypothetical protein n=1 Tax=Actinoplanes sp. NPDC026623 TaxID=3155610 RepID=UPI0033C30AEB
MSGNPTAQAGTALSPEWDRGFDEAFAELISGDPDLVRAEFDAIIDAGFNEPPDPPAPPAPSAPSAARPASPRPESGSSTAAPADSTEHQPGAAGENPRSPP